MLVVFRESLGLRAFHMRPWGANDAPFGAVISLHYFETPLRAEDAKRRGQRIGDHAVASDDSDQASIGKAHARARVNDVGITPPFDLDVLEDVTRSRERPIAQENKTNGWRI